MGTDAGVTINLSLEHSHDYNCTTPEFDWGCKTIMPKLSVTESRNPAAIGRTVTLQGWIRTRRDSKGGFSFLELNDGSCLANIQIVADANLPNYESEVKKLSPGCSVTIRGEVKPSGGKEQATEVHASEVIVHGWADPDEYPLQKKRHTFEKLREWAHLRPRTNTFGAVARVRNRICRSIHDFFQEEGFLYLQTPIITASDCEGAGAMFRVSTLDPANAPRTDKGDIDYTQDFFHRPASSKARSTPPRSAKSIRSAPRSAPRIRTPPATSPSSGWSSPRRHSSIWTTTWRWLSGF
jgi:asparaginyl-tRNA synthetase